MMRSSMHLTYCLPKAKVRWVYVYNVLRPHTGVGMDGKSPLAVLKGLGYNGDEDIALFPPIILDRISADLILSCDKEVGNDLLAHYNLKSPPKLAS